MNNLKAKEKLVFEYIKEEIKLKGYPPTVREIGAAYNIKSTSTVHNIMKNLEKKGFIKKDPSKPRALTILLDKEDKEDKIENDISFEEKTNTIDIPIVGRVAAGTPILAEENIEDTFPVPTRFLGRGNNFMLIVKGESMIEAGIFDGDYILVEERSDAENGDIVVAQIDGFESEATVKTFYREKDHIRLQPANSSMSPIIVKNLKILGHVKGVFRYFS